MENSSKVQPGGVASNGVQSGKLDRRTFGAMMLALSAMPAAPAEAQESALIPPVPGPDGKGAKPGATGLPVLASGTFSPGPGYGSLPRRTSHRYLMGLLNAGNIQLEMHETIQQPGAQHEPVETHKHSEIWCVQRGTGALYINGAEHRMEAGDIGLVCAGDEHWIRNAGATELAYFVITVGPPE